ncbi:ABC transporter ATP-binding protein [bacterium]|nr:ABC transporter ATP-binding protein [candidate division CSSED10-310 bacterium]
MAQKPVDILAVGLQKQYGDIRALQGIDLSVTHGERFGLIGPDGAGKTTLIRVLCGLIRQDKGTFQVAGLDGMRSIRTIKSILGYMPQKFSLYPDLTVGENLRFFADLFHVIGAQRQSREERLLHFSRLGPFWKRRAGALSGGMKQKLALSCALIHTPAILILDEPTTGVDPVSRREFWEILRELSDRDGTTILVSTPYMDEATRCHRVGFMNEGRLLATDTPDNLIHGYPYRVIQVHGENLFPFRKALETIPGVRSVCALGEYLRVSTEKTDAVVHAIGDRLTHAGATGFRIRTVAPLLEDMFVNLLESGRVS